MSNPKNPNDSFTNTSTFKNDNNQFDRSYKEAKTTGNNLLEEGKDKLNNAYEEGKDMAEDLYNQTKEKASDLYDEGMKKMYDAQDNLKEYSDELVKNVREKPFTSLLIAGGIGFIISALLRK